MAEATYKDQLRERLQDFVDNRDQVRVDDMFEFVFQVSLESWKAGKAAGARMAFGPERRSGSKGTALQNGKLRPVGGQRAPEPELLVKFEGE